MIDFPKILQNFKMNKQLLYIALVFLFCHVSQSVYFENVGCLQKTADEFECARCDTGYNLQKGLCRKIDFNVALKSDHQYQRVYVGEQIILAANTDPILGRVIQTVKQHPLYQPLITMVREKSHVASRTNYRVFIENDKTQKDFFVYYFYKTNTIKVVDLDVKNVAGNSDGVNNAGGNQRLLMAQPRMLGVIPNGNGALNKIISSLVRLNIPDSKTTSSTATPAKSTGVTIIEDKKPSTPTVAIIQTPLPTPVIVQTQTQAKNTKTDLSKDSSKQSSKDSSKDTLKDSSEELSKQSPQVQNQIIVVQKKSNTAPIIVPQAPIKATKDEKASNSKTEDQKSSKSQNNDKKDDKKNKQNKDNSKDKVPGGSKPLETPSKPSQPKEDPKVPQRPVEQPKPTPKPQVSEQKPGIRLGHHHGPIVQDECERILRNRKFVGFKSLTHKWSHHQDLWRHEMKHLDDKWVKCKIEKPQRDHDEESSEENNNDETGTIPTPTPIDPTPIPIDPISNPVDPIPTPVDPTPTPNPVIIQTQVTTPTTTTPYIQSKEHSGSQTIVDNEVFITENNLPVAYFTDDVRMVLQLFSIQQQSDLSDNVIHIEYHGDGVVDEYAVTVRFRANDTVRFYALRMTQTNEYLYMGKDEYPATWDPASEENVFLYSVQPQKYNDNDKDLFLQLSAYITANNGTHYNFQILEITKRLYPAGTYFITNVHIDNDVNAVSHAVKLNAGNFMSIKYKETSIKVVQVPVIDTISNGTTPTNGNGSSNPSSNSSSNSSNPTPTDTTISCCSTLQQKQDACVVYLKQSFSDVPHLQNANLVTTYNQVLPSGVSFDFYLEYADELICLGYEATVARYEDGSFAILMFDYY